MSASLEEEPDLPDEIIQAGLNGELVLFIGAGVSQLIGLPSWTQLAHSVLDDLRSKDFINFSELEQLKTLDAKKQLSIAENIAEMKGYSINLNPYLSTAKKNDEIYDYLNRIGCPFVTTNYDEFLQPKHQKTVDGSTTITPVLRTSSPDKIFANLLNKPASVIHLHGSIAEPETVIASTKRYLLHYDNDNIKAFLPLLFETKTVLFIGYGLEETEILEYILRRGQIQNSQSKIRKRFALQGYFKSQQPLYEKLHKYYSDSFGVHLLGFNRDNEDYRKLSSIMKTWSVQIKFEEPPLSSDVEFMESVLNG